MKNKEKALEIFVKCLKYDDKLNKHTNNEIETTKSNFITIFCSSESYSSYRFFSEKSDAREYLCRYVFEEKLLNNKDFAKLIFSIHVMRNKNTNFVTLFGFEEAINMYKYAKTPFVSEDSLNEFNNLPTSLIIYRGISDVEENIARNGFCWTLDKKITNQFINPSGKTNYLFKGEIDKNNIYAYINTRFEQEIIVNPKKIRNIINIYGE